MPHSIFRTAEEKEDCQPIVPDLDLGPALDETHPPPRLLVPWPAKSVARAAH